MPDNILHLIGAVAPTIGVIAMPDNILHLIGAVAPTIGVIATGGFGYLAAKSNNLNRAQFAELSQKMQVIQETAGGNCEKLQSIEQKVGTLEDSSRSSRRYLLYRDLDVAIARGWTTLEERRELAKLFESYKILGGNGEIEEMYHIYRELPLQED